MSQLINLGIFEYVNIWPVYYDFLFTDLPHPFKLYHGKPTSLNQMVAKGFLNLSCISSLAYPVLAQDLNLKKILKLIPNLSLSTRGPVGSVLLLSQVPLEKISGNKIFVAAESRTSSVLLQVLFNALGIQAEFITSLTPEQELEQNENCAALLIGDPALIASQRLSQLHQYDLGDIWWRTTKKPFVWALWGIGVDLEHPVTSSHLLLKSCENGLAHLDVIAKRASDKLGIHLSVMEKYFSRFDYSLHEESIEGLQLFYKKAAELELSLECNSIKFLRLQKKLSQVS